MKNMRQKQQWFGGPACLEIFGETPFQPVQKEDVYTYHKGQEQLEVQYRGKANQIVNEYIKPEERSFYNYCLSDAGDRGAV